MTDKEVNDMSENKEAKKKSGKPGFFTRAKNWICSLPKRFIGAFKNMVAELKNVTWPTRKELINYSLVVIGFVVALALVIGLLDTGSSFLVRWLIEL